MRTRPPIALVTLVAAAVSLGLGAVSAPAQAKTVHTSDPGAKKHKFDKVDHKKNKKDKKGNDGVGPFKKKDYPVSVRLRPLVLPNQMAQVGADFDATRVAGVPGVTDSSTGLGLGVNFAYGIGNRFDFGAATGLALSPDAAWSQGITLQAHYLSYDTKQLDFAPGLVLPLAFYNQAPFSAVVDLPCRYVLDNGLFLRFGQGAVPVGLSPDFSLAVVGNGGIGYQVIAPFELFVDTSLITLALAPDAAVSGIWQTLAFDLGGQYSPTKDWDIGARLNGTNVWKVDNSFLWSVALFANYRF